ncbi:MAG: pantetheine-phosphate adenylyltransferase [Candidatus Cloacimonadota bacterium]|nr:pantetheine-phosphate adenylyltransferase [Candidatus Cloacimonadota bacterium]
MKKIAIYPGTFDPITNGHLDILEKATNVFDEVILAVANTTGKKTLCSLSERHFLCEESTKYLSKVKVMSFEGLAVEFAREIEADCIVRGLRAVSDFEYELQLALMNKNLEKKIDTMFFIPDLEHLYLSSSMIRQIVSLGGDLKEFIPEVVEEMLLKKFSLK